MDNLPMDAFNPSRRKAIAGGVAVLLTGCGGSDSVTNPVTARSVQAAGPGPAVGPAPAPAPACPEVDSPVVFLVFPIYAQQCPPR